MKLIGVHWIPAHRDGTDKTTFARWNPCFVKIITVDEKVPYLEDVPVGSTIIVRHHPLSELYGNRDLRAFMSEPRSLDERYERYFQEYCTTSPERERAVLSTDNAVRIAREHAQVCHTIARYCESAGVSRTRLVFEGLNEPQLWANEPPKLVNAYYREFLATLHGMGLHGVIGNFGVGWPGNGGVANAPPEWDFFAGAIAEMQAGDYLGLHEYWSLQGPAQNWGWWAGRFTQCPYQVPILITECGIDTGVTGAWFGGWGDLPGSWEQKANRYVSELVWYANRCREDKRVRGVTPFTYDIGSREWEKFNIKNQVFATVYGARLSEVPESVSDTGGGQMNIEEIRNQAWNRERAVMGIPYTPEHAFPRYARANNLGAPLSNEWDYKGYRIQQFANGIVWARIGDWDNIKHNTW